jgi:hypothetical protein
VPHAHRRQAQGARLTCTRAKNSGERASEKSREAQMISTKDKQSRLSPGFPTEARAVFRPS